ncbi:MAG: hypothetical protein ACFFBE_14205 [Promethearchaeota archaeon]
MVINWTPEGITDFIVGTGILIAALLTYFEPKTKRIKSLLFMRIGMILLTGFFYFDGLNILFLDHTLSRISLLLLVFGIGLFLIGVSLVVTDSYNSVFLILYSCIGAISCYLAFQPGLIKTVTEAGYLNVNWVGILSFMGDILQGIGSLIIMYWGLKTWLNVPFLIRREALIYLTGIILIGPVTLIIYILYYFDPLFILWANSLFCLGMLIYNIAILMEPKVLYILPFTVYRIIIKDREGAPLYDHDWTESSINENIFTGFLNAVQLMSEELMNIGGLLDINLEHGILIVYESKYITVGLVSSKSSKLLRDSVVEFTQDFERKFERELKKLEKDMDQYLGAFELVEKHFSNFPYKMIKDKKQSLLLTGKYLRIPPELDNKLRSAFRNEEEYEAIKTELIKAPLSVPPDFFKSYKEMKDELKKIFDDELKYLEKNSNVKN